MSRRTRFCTPTRILLAACALMALAGIAAGYSYAQRRTSALAYIGQSSSRSMVSFAPIEWWPASVPLPEWIRTVEQVDLSHRPCDLRRLTALAELNRLNCEGCEIDREGFHSLPAFTRLEILHLEESTVTDDDLAVLHQCPRLSKLDLGQTKITDQGLRHLAGMQIVSLNLSYTAIDDAGLKHLSGLPLRHLALACTQVTDEGMLHLAKCSSLKTLMLTDTEIGDAGVQQLAGLPLSWLFVTRTRVTDGGVAALRSAPLELLSLNETDVTIDAIPLLVDIPTLQMVELSRPPFNDSNTRVLKDRAVRVMLWNRPTDRADRRHQTPVRHPRSERRGG